MPDPGGGPGTLDLDRVDARLTDAIQDGGIRDEVDRLLADETLLTNAGRRGVREAAAALAAIDESVDVERRRLITRLEAGGVHGRPGPGLGDRPLLLVTLDVDRADLDTARRIFASAGYLRHGPSGSAVWRSLRATRERCTLHPADGDVPFRVELGWDPSPLARNPAGRLVRPHDSDYAALALPGSLWMLYSLVHVLRLPGRRWRSESDLGPFLSTPSGLIEPLLRFADLGPDDQLVDLGCGDGRILIAAAERFGCRARGVEADGVLAERALRAVDRAGLGDRVEIVRGDVFTAPLDDAQVVVAFLPVGMLERVVASRFEQLPPGARLVAHEQERIRTARPPDARRPLFSVEGISVAHRWDR